MILIWNCFYFDLRGGERELKCAHGEVAMYSQLSSAMGHKTPRDKAGILHSGV